MSQVAVFFNWQCCTPCGWNGWRVFWFYGNSLGNLILAACRTVLSKLTFGGPLLTLECQLDFLEDESKNKKNKKIYFEQGKNWDIFYFLQLSLSFHHLLTLHSDTPDSQVQMSDFPFLYYTAWASSQCSPQDILHPRFVAFINSTPQPQDRSHLGEEHEIREDFMEGLYLSWGRPQMGQDLLQRLQERLFSKR